MSQAPLIRDVSDSVLVSMCYLILSGPRCLSFAFHMYGSAQNASLSIYKYLPGDTPQLLWTTAGRHDDVWLQAQVDVDHELYTQVSGGQLQ